MTWSKDKPTAPNRVWWYRKHDHDDPRLVIVKRTDRKLWIDAVQTKDWKYMDDCDGEWHPVTPPPREGERQ